MENYGTYPYQVIITNSDWIRRLEVAELVTILDQFGDKQPIPSNSSKTIHFVREEKFINVPADLTPRIKEEYFATLITDEDEDA